MHNFRVWNYKEREMIYPTDNQDSSTFDLYISLDGALFNILGSKKMELPKNSYDLMQATGIISSGGRMIYENDVILLPNNNFYYVRSILDFHQIILQFKEGCDFEIIGSVHEDKSCHFDLMGEGEKE